MPLIQSGLSLVISSIVTSALGFVFWILAARQFTSADLGIGSAVITAMILLADLAHIGLRTGLVRFLPTSGPGARRLIGNSYAIAVGLAVVGALVFLAGLNLWTPDLIGLRQSFWLVALFVAATAFWVVFLLEDSVLLGLRLAPWVPVENGVFGLLKIALLIPMAAVSDEFGVFLAWSLPVFAVVAVVNLGVSHTLRRSPVEPDDSAEPTKSAVPMGEVLSYSAVDWAASMARTAVIGILPLMVLVQLGSQQSAYYFVAWTITYSVYILSANIGDALVAEASYDDGNVDRHTLHSGLLSMAISVPIVAVATVAAPLVLRAFDTEYAEAATTVLRLLLIGAIPNVVTRTFIGRLRAERRMKAVVVYELALSLSVLFLGWLLLGPLGINGLGVAWLTMLTVAALYVLVVESVWWWAPKLDPRLVALGARIVEPIRRRALRLPMPGLDGDVRRSLGRLYRSRPRWRRVELTADTQTVAVEGHDGRPPLRIELARNPEGNTMLGLRHRAVTDLGDLTGLPGFRALVPFPIDHDRSVEHHYLVESALSGVPGHQAATTMATTDLVESIGAAMSELHDTTAGCLTLDEDDLNRLVSQPLRRLGDAARIPPADLVTIGRLICDGLGGQVVPTARIHGSLTLANARFDTSGKLTGLLNWERSEIGPTYLDWGSLALSTASVDFGQDLGPLVRRLLEEPEVLLEHHALADKPVPPIEGRSLVLWSWLHQLGPDLRLTSTSSTDRFWMARNVAPVLDRLATTTSVHP